MWTVPRPTSRLGIPTITGLIGPHSASGVHVTATRASPSIRNSNVAHPVLVMGGGTASESVDDSSAARFAWPPLVGGPSGTDCAGALATVARIATTTHPPVESQHFRR